jgi:hypothetical protein
MDTILAKQLYDDGKSLKEIAAEFNTYPQKVHRELIKVGYTPRNFSDAQRERRRKNPKFHYNREFLGTWSMESAWFLGLMFADGNIWQDRTRAALTSKDHDLLLQVRDVIDSDFIIQEKATTPQLIMYGMDFVEQLEQYGLHPHKSLNKIFPAVPPECMSHFLRGYWDGNGWISIRKTGRNLGDMSIGVELGSLNFAKGIQHSLECVVQPPVYFTERDRKPHEWNGHMFQSTCSIYSVRVHGDRAKEILRWMYADSTPQTRLARKYEKALPFLTDHQSST